MTFSNEEMSMLSGYPPGRIERGLNRLLEDMAKLPTPDIAFDLAARDAESDPDPFDMRDYNDQ